MKRYLALIILFLTTAGLSNSFSQDLRRPAYEGYFSDCVEIRDSMLLKYRYRTVKCYECFVRPPLRDSCLWRTAWEIDSLGRLVKNIEGQNLTTGKKEYDSHYDYFQSGMIKIAKTYYPLAFGNINYRYLYEMNRSGIIEGFKFKKCDDGSIVIHIENLTLENGDVLQKAFDCNKNLRDSLFHSKRSNQPSPRIADDSLVNEFGRTYTYRDTISGNVIEKRSYNSFGKIIERSIVQFAKHADTPFFALKNYFFYDRFNHLISEIILDKNNVLSREKRYRFNENGFLVFSSDKTENMSTEIIGNKNGRELKVTVVDKLNKNSRVDNFTYDRVTGVLVKEQLYINAKLISYKKYLYN